MRILVVEDDAVTQGVLLDGITAGGHTARAVANAEEARTALHTETWDLAILDLGLPGADGRDLLRHLRRRDNPLPVLILTGRDGLADRVGALDQGADDYMLKPFAIAEVLARCRALVRRSHLRANNRIEVGRLAVDFATHAVSLDGIPLPLTRSEWRLLEPLVLEPGRIVAKEALAAALAVAGGEATPHAVETGLSRLRARLGSAVSIRALRGLGYRLDAHG